MIAHRFLMLAARKSGKGFILLDVLIGLFIFGLGFAVITGVINTAALAGGEAQNYLQAVNLASSTMDELLNLLEIDNSSQYAYLGKEGKEQVGTFEKLIKMEWESVDLLLVTVEIKWKEKGEVRNYLLESLFYVQAENI